jgi:xylulokinase
MGVMLSAAAAFGWYRQIVDREYSALVEAAAAWDPGADGLMFLPYLAGERTPHADPRARAAFVGLELRHDAGALARAVLEGVAFGLRDSLDLLYELGAPVSVGRASGGGARSRLWLQIVASVLELPLERVAVDEGAAFGAALLGGVAAGVWDDVAAAVENTVRVREVVEPVPEWVEIYGELRERWRGLYPALSSR